jgi:threonine dehydrogenase-like Zn-dependent dehydrogenase
MQAVCWEGKEKIRVETVPDPVIPSPRDAIIKVTTTAICGSDLHIYDGYGAAVRTEHLAPADS